MDMASRKVYHSGMNSPKHRRSLLSLRLTSPMHKNLVGSAWLLGLLFLVSTLLNVYMITTTNQEWMIYAPSGAQEIWADQQAKLMNVFYLQCFLFVVGGFLLSLIVAHRIGGTYLAIIRTCNQVMDQGTATRLKFRETDHLPEVEKAFNTMLDGLESREEGTTDEEPTG